MSPVAVVTGGSRGIGRAVCLEAAARGYDVVIAYAADESAASAVRAEVEQLGRRGVTVQGDLCSPAAPQDLAVAARAFGPVSLLVNNAGLTLSAPLAELTRADFDRALALNLTAPVFLSRELAPDLGAHHGAIVNVGSTGGLTGSVHSLGYSASKSGLVGATKTLARMLAPAVRVNLVAPGITDTDLLSGIRPSQQEEILAPQLMPRLGTAAEVGRVVLDVAQWTYATGQTVVADGGRVL